MKTTKKYRQETAEKNACDENAVIVGVIEILWFPTKCSSREFCHCER